MSVSEKIEVLQAELDGAYAEILRLKNEVIKLQGEPVKLPDRLPESVSFYPTGWNDCLDEIAKLGPLYTKEG